MLPQANNDIREARNYPEQPPVIPHTIEATRSTSTSTSA